MASDKETLKPGSKWLRTLGILLALFAVCSLSFTVVDIILTTFVVCTSGVKCPPHAVNPATNDWLAALFSYIASGIWASLAVFVSAVWTIKRATTPKSANKSRTFYLVVGFVTTFIFAPVMIAINVIETYFTVKLNKVGTIGDVSGLVTEKLIKLIIPIVVAAFALIEFLIASVILIKAFSEPQKLQQTQQQQQQQQTANSDKSQPSQNQMSADDDAQFPPDEYPEAGYGGQGYGAAGYSPYDYGQSPYRRPRAPYPVRLGPYGIGRRSNPYAYPAVQRYAPPYPAITPRYSPRWSYGMMPAAAVPPSFPVALRRNPGAMYGLGVRARQPSLYGPRYYPQY